MNGDSTYEIYLMMGTLFPFISFVVLMLFGHRLGKPLSGWITVAAMASSCVLATMTLVGWMGEIENGTSAGLTQAAQLNQVTWAHLGSIPLDVGVKLDSLTIIMFFMVTFVATWIFVFSVGYMAGHSDEVDGQSKYHRFFCYLSLFGFSMLGLLCSSSLLFLFIFWELVGLCSYLLIGFYFDRKYASNAAIKAFVTNRVGDFGFLFGLMMVAFFLGTFDLEQAAARFAEQYQSHSGLFADGMTINLLGWNISGGMLATMMGVGLFCGAMGKSAQFPLHVWLPDAMAGPTPVSALIHAATMVAAGVYLVARVFRLLTPDAQMFIAIIGAITLTLMALIAIVQVDIKKCLAYSTLSQLGYMIFGMGCGAWVAALFHLMTHAFFKAMLFLCSGQVIEGCHHEQDMRKMGGLFRKMPVTAFTFLIGVLAISGFGIPLMGVGLGGYFSKDEILAVAWDRAFLWGEPLEHHGEQHAARGIDPRMPRGGIATAPDARVLPGSMSVAPYGSESIAGPLPYGRGSERSTLAASHLRGSGAGLQEADRATPYRLASDPQHDDHGAAHDAGGGVHHSAAGAWQRSGSDGLWRVLFWCALATAYITPFYMMRAWWMTFMGKPRDEHVYHHAHESPLMWFPLVVLAVFTFISSYWLFRPLIADAAPAASGGVLVTGYDGVADDAAAAAGQLIHVHEAHHWLAYGVGGSWLIAFVAAIAVYRGGLALPTRLKVAFGPIATLLERKYYFDELYGLVFVKGCVAFAYVCRFVDTYIVDMLANLSARLTERLANFSGNGVDARVVDGVFNGIAVTSFDISELFRSPQTGRIRNYVLFAAGGAAVIVLFLIIMASLSAGPVAVAATGG